MTRPWWRSLVSGGGSFAARHASKPRQRYRPTVEALEDRLTPVTINVANGDVVGLNNAITMVNGSNQANTINLAAGGVYNIGATLNPINLVGALNTLTLNANGATIQPSAGAFRLVWFQAGNATFNNLTIANAAAPATNGGGGLLVSQGANSGTTLTMNNCTLSGNTAGYGGGMFIYGSNTNVTISNSTLTGNVANSGAAAAGGGAIEIWNAASGTKLNIYNSSITTNNCTVDGAAIKVDGANSSVKVVGSTISGNSTTSNGARGGAISVVGSGASVTLTNDSLTTNTTKNSAGFAISVTGVNDTLNVTGSTISGNSNVGVTNGNGALYLNGTGVATAKIYNSAISGNLGDYRGGMFIAGTENVTIAGTTIDSNIAYNGYGGAIGINAGTLTINNCTIANNTANKGANGGSSNGGGLCIVNTAVVVIRDSTITGNMAPFVASGKGGGISIFNPPGSTLTVSNSIIAGNSAGSVGPDLNDTTGISNVSFSLIGSTAGNLVTATAANGNIINVAANLGPLQFNGGISTGAPSSLTPLRTVALLAGSPAIDKGSNVKIAAGVTTDERGPGFNRIINNTVDMGSFEYQPPATTTTITSSLNPSNFGQAVTFTATVTATAAGSNAIQGTVTFLDNGTALGTVTLSGGMAVFTTAALTGGSHTITAQYNGFSQGSYTFSASMATLTQTVIPAPAPPPPPPPPPPTATGIFAIGAEAGSVGVVDVYDARTMTLKYTLLPFGPLFTGGVRVAVGDVNGDGVADIICGAGPGGLPQVIVYDGTTGQAIQSFIAFAGASAQASNIANVAPFFSGGIFVAAGDVFGTGRADIIVGADAGGGPQVQVIDGRTGNVVMNFFAFGVAGFHGGVRVASADINGDGHADIICAAGPGGGPEVVVYDGTNLSPIAAFFAMPAAFAGGVYVGVGDVNGDKRPDIICGAGPGAGPQVSIFDGTNFAPLAAFFAYPAAFRGGVRVAGRDVNGDGKADILTGPGPGGLPEFNAFDGSSLALLTSFFPNTFARGGLYVG
jgi:hypothetical protein